MATGYTIELEFEQVDAIIIKELQSALEGTLRDYHDKVDVFEKRSRHRDLIDSMHHTLSYFMPFDEFQKYASTLNWPDKNKRNKTDWL